jgi:23S rRNA (cytosine1962-C5)-methyltransferase
MDNKRAGDHGQKLLKVDPPRLRLRISPAAQTALRKGHPWLYSDAIREQNREGKLGELAVIYDRNDRFLAVGLFEPESPIRVRLLHSGKPVAINDAWWKGRFLAATEKRAGLFDSLTNGFRWINGESDGWPGLVLDRFNTTLVLKIYTGIWLSRLPEVVRLIVTQLQPERIVLRFSRNLQALASGQFALSDGQVIYGPSVTGPVVFQETGLSFEADVLRGQKTGFFLDQRENRKYVESLAAGREVLNAFSFSGGFSLYAARGGAVSVCDLDISRHALESSQRNFNLNQKDPRVAGCRHEFVQADAFEWLRQQREHQFDLVVLDPPSLAKREAEREGALGAYGALATAGVERLKNDGILLACSCSAHVRTEEFYSVIRRAAQKSGRACSELRTVGHAPDHPATFAEAEYLKAICLRFSEPG